jgi:hypothetical protein
MTLFRCNGTQGALFFFVFAFLSFFAIDAVQSRDISSPVAERLPSPSFQDFLASRKNVRDGVSASPFQLAEDFLSYSLKETSFHHLPSSKHTSKINGVAHFYSTQTLDGIPIINTGLFLL